MVFPLEARRCGRRAAFAVCGLLVLTVGGLAVGLTLWNRIADRKVTELDATRPRDPVSGIIRGAEPRDVGPEDARGAVLFIHGFSGCGNNFETLPERVAEAGWRARVMLLPGHGTSPFEFERVTEGQLLDAVLDETRQLLRKHEKVVLLGHSMGGALATIAAAQLPGVSGLVLGAPYFAITPRWYYVLPPERWVRRGPSLMRWVHMNPDRQPVFRHEVSREIVSYGWAPTKAAIVAMGVAAHAADSATLARITQPVLLLHGRRDEVTSPNASVKAVNGMRSTNKRIVLLDNSNHILFWDYEREAVTKEVLAFLSERLSTP